MGLAQRPQAILAAWLQHRPLAEDDTSFSCAANWNAGQMECRAAIFRWAPQISWSSSLLHRPLLRNTIGPNTAARPPSSRTSLL